MGKEGRPGGGEVSGRFRGPSDGGDGREGRGEGAMARAVAVGGGEEGDAAGELGFRRSSVAGDILARCSRAVGGGGEEGRRRGRRCQRRE